MLTPEQIEALSEQAAKITDPINKFLLDDICRRVAGAGQLTSSAAYQIYKAQQLGLSRKEIEKYVKNYLKINDERLTELFTQSAEVGYSFDIAHLPKAAVPFAKNERLQQTVSAAVKLAQKDFTNITQTMGMVDPHGRAQPLQKAYQKCMDYAFNMVSTGATDYNTAVRTATKNLADMGVRVIDYESGVHTGIEAAARRNIMGGLGLMQEQISKENHDTLGADGWEISAHMSSAPDHEPYQGKQYSDMDYWRLNGGEDFQGILHRRIGTLNCGHAAFPIIMGVNTPQYTKAQTDEFARQNAEGVAYEGRHYTMYEASQKQRQVERAIRKQKNRVLVADATGDKDKLLTAQIRLRRLNDEYARFSKGVGLRTQRERAQVTGFGNKQAGEAVAAYNFVAKTANVRYNTGSTENNVAAYLRDIKTSKFIQSEEQLKTIENGKQGKHIKVHNNYIEGRSYLTITSEKAQELVNQFAGKGQLVRDENQRWANKERIAAEQDIGVWVSGSRHATTKSAIIHYSKKGTHIVPGKPLEEKEK